MGNKLQLKRSAVPGKVPTTADLDLGEIAINTYDGKAYMKKNVGGVESIVLLVGAGSGDVNGPASSVDNAIARFDGVAGKAIQNSGATIDDSGNISAPTFLSTATSADLLPKGTDAQRPASPVAGNIRFNTTQNVVEAYHTGLGWLPLSNTFQAAGGNVTTYTDGTGTYNVHTFTSSGTFQVTNGTQSVDYLCIAGGGGGGHNDTPPKFSGGGAGGVLQGTVTASVGGYAVTVGGGGAAARTGGSGGNSSAFGVTAIGGGGGGTGGGGYGGSGGSGGGQGGTGSSSLTPNNAPGTAGQGNAGGQAVNNSSDAAGGGGGYSGQGQNATTGTSGNGGAGLTSSITGTSTTYAGGGGRTNQGYKGGYSGAPAGIANSGGGGAGSAGNGGSGVVIIRYKFA